MQTCNSKLWTARLPDDWICETQDDIEILYHPEGVGALEISASEQPETIGDDDLKYFTSDQIEAGISIAEATCGAFTGIELLYEHETLFWHEWFLRNGKILLLATYTCPLGDEEKEEAMLDVILATLQTK